MYVVWYNISIIVACYILINMAVFVGRIPGRQVRCSSEKNPNLPLRADPRTVRWQHVYVYVIQRMY